nr:hypothetical protein B0A51_14629 [Rachicladosporium sp. CCFEE 5018]
MAAYYTFEDFSGAASASQSDNPYDGLIETCDDDPSKIQAVYEKHRTNRNAQQKAKLLAPDFSGVVIDEMLAQLQSGGEDWRHCLVFWARPPTRIRELIVGVQRRLLTIAPNMWIMPPENLHMTALEVTHSRTATEIDSLVKQLSPSAHDIADCTHDHRARLIRPMISFDAQALAVSFLPASGDDDDQYSYHHLRRDVFNKVQAAGVKVESRYVVPSAHLTVGRFVTKQDFEVDGKVDHEKVAKLVETIESINAWLENEVWPSPHGEWRVGQETGLDHRQGTLWYGGGATVYLGKAY